MADVRTHAAFVLMTDEELDQVISLWMDVRNGRHTLQPSSTRRMYETANRIIADKYGWPVAAAVWHIYSRGGTTVDNFRQIIAEDGVPTYCDPAGLCGY